jgi:hypothetical protein
MCFTMPVETSILVGCRVRGGEEGEDGLSFVK